MSVEAIPLVVVALVAGLVCPAVMWWNRRRGRDAACCVDREVDDLADLRERQVRLSARIAEARRREGVGRGG